MAFRAPLSLSRYLILPTAATSLMLLYGHQTPQLQRQLGFLGASTRTLRADAPPGWGSGSRSSGVTKSGEPSWLNARVARQVSGGSIMGLVCGAAVAYLSKPIAILMGLFIVGVQYLEYKGVHIIPFNSLQRYFKSIDLQAAIQDDPAFKLAFGVTFALAGFGQL